MKEFYVNELLNDVIPFWMKHGIDYEYGGYFTCLDQKGELYDDEKSVWFQGRTLYTISKLICDRGKNEEWLRAANAGYEFIQKCYLPNGRMPFTVNREGVYTRKRRYFFSETFAAIGLAAYFQATGDIKALNLSKKTYETAMKCYKGEILEEPKFNPLTVREKALAVPMILLSTTQALRAADPEDEKYYNENIDMFIKDIKDFVRPELQCCLESVSPEGNLLNGPRGRLVNPGHSLECAWFLSEEAEYRNDDELFNLALNITDWSFEIGWDKENGGIAYFADIKGKPLTQLEWDMRLWWPHNEALIALIKAYRLTGDAKYMNQFKAVHEYSFSHFKDNEYGEWFGYLRRDGSVNNTIKGSLFKGPFHLPRCLSIVAEEFEKIEQKKQI